MWVTLCLIHVGQTLKIQVLVEYIVQHSCYFKHKRICVCVRAHVCVCVCVCVCVKQKLFPLPLK
jgi:hypothetical protein